MAQTNYPPNVLFSCKLWVHDDSFSTKDVLLNIAALPIGAVNEGALLIVNPLSHHYTVAFPSQGPTPDAGSHGSRTSRQGFVFVAKDCDHDIKTKHTNLQLSVSAKIAKLYGFKNFTEVCISEAEKGAHSATHVEICFRDVYLTRANLHRLVATNLLSEALFEGESINFLGSMRASVKSIYCRGHRVYSAFFTKHTKPIFRSESARFILYIQMSREMWDFDTEGSGEIIFNKVVENVLPELFRRWADLNARHLVSVVLFTRLEDGSNLKTYASNNTSQPNEPLGLRDFYRVVVGEMYSCEGGKILQELKTQFKSFLRDVLTHACDDASYIIPDSAATNAITTAQQGNFLEAINLASSRFGKDWIDPDLLRTGLNVIVITPGTGFFQVDPTLLKLTNENLVRNGVSIDLVCLSQSPLHMTPVFGFQRNLFHNYKDAFAESNQNLHLRSRRYFDVPRVDSSDKADLSFSGKASPEQDQDGGLSGSTSWTYVAPQWIQVHFWSSDRNTSKQRQAMTQDALFNQANQLTAKNFAPACRMYEVQMTGIMENEMSDISLPFLHIDKMNILEKVRQRNGSTLSHSPYRSSFHESPPKSIYLTSDFHRTLSPKPQTERSLHSLELQDWMDEYDRTVFERRDSKSMKTAFTVSNARSVDKRHRKQAAPIANVKSNISGPRPLSSSPSTSTYSVSKSSNRIAFHMSNMNVDKNMPDNSNPSVQNNKETSHNRARLQNLGHLLPMGGSLTSSRKADPSMYHATEVAVSSNLERDVLHSDTNHYSQKRGPISRQVRDSLLRHPSGSRNDVHSPADTELSGSTALNVLASHQQEQSQDGEMIQSSRRYQPRQDMATYPNLDYESSSHIKSRSSEVNQLLTDLNFVVASSPWLSVCNPSRPRDHLTGISAHHGWTHVFVHRNKILGVKWKSLCSPAVLPLSSDYQPSNEVLEAYEENSYKVTISDDDLLEIPLARARLLDQMVSFRLGKGFQLLPKACSPSRSTENLNSIHFYEDVFKEDNLTLTMSKGNAIHMVHVSGPEIQITRYRPQHTSSQLETTLHYSPRIKTTFEKEYTMRKTVISAPLDDLNWSVIDNFLAGYPSSFTNNIGFWRARFVLIPVGPPSSTRRPLPALAEDSDDEIYIEGVQRLTQLWEKSRLNPQDASVQPILSLQQGDPNPNPLNLEFQTRDASAVVLAGIDGSLLQEDRSPFPSSQLFSDTELYSLSKLDIRKLANDLQGDNGIKMHDRRWYFRTHPNCFVGIDLTSWLLYRFQDVENRNSAIDLGQNLMDKGLFKHVSGRHKFRDGNYFYQITSEYRIAKPDSRAGWFLRKPDKGSASSNQHTDVSNDSPSQTRVPAKTGRNEPPQDNTKPERVGEVGKTRPTIRLSSVLQCDLDFRKRSDRLEVVDLHYDRLYNPDSCYHFRLEWMNATAKLVYEAISSWAANAERYGLRLVQVPLVEACRIAESNPFRSPYIVDLAVAPPKASNELQIEGSSPALRPTLGTNAQYYYKALLRKFGFVLESEAASNFPSDVNIGYSWGHDVPYQYSQYIHKSGFILAQLTEAGKILLLANRLADNRSSHIRDPGRHEKRGKRDETLNWPPGNKEVRSGAPPSSRKSLLVTAAMTAPIDNMLQWGSNSDEKQLLTAEQIKDQIEAFCQNETALRSFYDEIKSREISHSAKSTPLLSATIPKFELSPVNDLTPLASLEASQEL